MNDRKMMRAAVLYGPRDLRINEVEIPKIKNEEVLIEVKNCGICTTDLHMYKWEFPVKTPVILGHECSGIVTDRGNDVKELNIGDKVAINPLISCGVCEHCKAGRDNLCKNALAIGGAGKVIVNGAFAEYLRVPWNAAEKIPEDMSFEVGAFIEPVACCIHGIELSKIRIGDSVAILGLGPIGLILLQLAKITGASHLIAIDPVEERRKIAEILGADITVDPTEGECLKYITEKLDGIDVVIEATGSPKALQQALSMVKRGGRITIFGVAPVTSKICISPFDVYFKELKITGAYALTKDSFRRAVSILHNRRIKVNQLITELLPLEKLTDAFSMMEKKVGLKKQIKL